MSNKYPLHPSIYELLSNKALEVLADYNIFSFPINVVALAKKLNAKCVKTPDKIREKIKSFGQSIPAFSCYERKSDGTINWTIYYDDSCPIERLRYSIAHEIKHIVFQETETTEFEEKGAEYFAKSLLAPSCVMIKEKIFTVEAIKNKFYISSEAGKYIMRGITNRTKKYGDNLKDYEVEYLNKMEEYNDSTE